SYKDIYKLKRKRLATILYYSFVLTDYTKYERTKLINQSLKRLLSICLFILSNIIVILPVLTMKILNVTLNYHIQIIFIFLTVLPWCESITFVFFDEMQCNFIKNTFQSNRKHRIQEHIGRRLSAYREDNPPIQTIEDK
ncbi:unnamed protein product, partial [Adineta steineri]